MSTLPLGGGKKSKTITSLYYTHTHTSSLLHTFSLVYTREREGVCVVEREREVWPKAKKTKKANLTGKSTPCMYLTRAFAFFGLLKEDTYHPEVIERLPFLWNEEALSPSLSNDYSVSEGEDKKQNDYFVILHTHTHTLPLYYTHSLACILERGKVSV